MAKDYKANLPFSTPAKLLKRGDEPTKINGVLEYEYSEGAEFFCSAKSYGGTEKVVNGVTVVEDTWQIDAYYNPDFGKGDRIRFLDNNSEFEILASPENINRQGKFMRFKVVAIGG